MPKNRGLIITPCKFHYFLSCPFPFFCVPASSLYPPPTTSTNYGRRIFLYVTLAADWSSGDSGGFLGEGDASP